MLSSSCFFSLLFFFQAEDGIRDGHVTGVQTCALPISGESIEIVALHQWYGPPADFEINSDGSVTFDLSLDCDGRHHFNYTIEDVHGDQDSANITVVRVNDASTEAALAESGIECPLS